MANRLNGKGFEHSTYYKNCNIDFLDIHNIHKVRDAYKKLMTTCMKLTKNNFFLILIIIYNFFFLK